MNRGLLIFSTLFICIVMSENNVFANEVEGETIFTSRCAACHSIEKRLVGPALVNVDQRRSEQWLVNFIRSSQTVIKGGDKYAVSLFNEFNQTIMPDHTDLTEDKIKSVISFIKDESKKITASTNTASFTRPIQSRPHYLPLTIGDYRYFIAFSIVLLMLVSVLYFAVSVNDTIHKIQNKLENKG